MKKKKISEMSEITTSNVLGILNGRFVLSKTLAPFRITYSSAKIYDSGNLGQFTYLCVVSRGAASIKEVGILGIVNHSLKRLVSYTPISGRDGPIFKYKIDESRIRIWFSNVHVSGQYLIPLDAGPGLLSINEVPPADAVIA